MSEEEIIKGITNIIYTCNDVIEDKEWYDQEEIESAKEQLKFTEGLLDLYNKEKEQNRVSINSINDLMKECNQENKRCAELAIELDKEKEKNKILSIQIIENEKLYDKETARLGNLIQELLKERND